MCPGVPVSDWATIWPRESKTPQARSCHSRTTVENAVRSSVTCCSLTTQSSRLAGDPQLESRAGTRRAYAPGRDLQRHPGRAQSVIEAAVLALEGGTQLQAVPTPSLPRGEGDPYLVALAEVAHVGLAYMCDLL